MRPTIADAINALVPEAEFGMSGGEIFWHDDREQPSDANIATSLESLEAEYDANQYQRDRQYPFIGDQLDMQYWDQVNSTTTWKDAIAKVKADNPKPE